ncbi:MAG: hypothetical protein Q4P32_01015 [Micrococcales bacterium]|nr:hypothetical protein [Micrococcales bacterium]
MTCHRSSDWTTSAVCADRRDLPWTSDTVDVTPWQAETMGVTCQGCPVRSDCLSAVDALDITGGWWAGRDRDPDARDPAELLPLIWQPILAPVRDDDPALGGHDGLAGVA